MSKDENFFSQFKEIINKFNPETQYADILYDSMSSLRIYKTKSQETISVDPKTVGFVLRTYNGAWEERAATSLEDLKTQAEKLSNKPCKSFRMLDSLKAWKTDRELIPKIPHNSVTLDEKLNQIHEIYSYIEKYDPRIINPIVAYSESSSERIFVNIEGSELRQVIPRTKFFLQPIAKEGSRIDFDYHAESGELGFELLKGLSTETLENVIKNSIEMLKAEHAPAGTFPVVLDPDMAGLIAHESFGHGLEADQVLRDRSYLTRHFQKRVASKIVNIYDDPTVVGQVGTYFFDDEGVPAKRTQLVQNGNLINYLHTRETASQLGTTPRGNGRRESFIQNVYVRMSNTYFGSGLYNLNNLFEGIKKGVYLVRGYFGMEDPLGGGMQCTSKKGYLIENGQISTLLGPITLSGQVLDLLKSIDAISNEEIKYHGGTCGKGHEDYVPVSSGGPHVRAQHAIIGPG